LIEHNATDPLLPCYRLVTMRVDALEMSGSESSGMLKAKCY